MIKKIIYLLLIFLTLFNSEGFSQKNKKQTKVLISTEFGDIKLVLFNETPKHRDNFIKLVKEGFYDSLLFHRVMNGFMIQGGDPDSRSAAANAVLGNGGPGYTLPANFDSTLIHRKGALAAARLPDYENPEKSSSGSQFYIVQGKKLTREEVDKIVKKKEKRSGKSYPVYTDEQYAIYAEEGGTPHLDMEYTIFGQVIEGLEVIDLIAKVKTGKANRPINDVKMTIKIVRK